MSDVIMSIYVLVMIGLVTALVFHSALGHRRMVSRLIWWTFLGMFVSTVGGVLLLGTFTPNMAEHSLTGREIYNAFTWGGKIPEYDETLRQVSNLGAVINAMGLGILVMAVIKGFFPRAFTR